MVTDLENAKIAKKSTGKRKFHKKSRKGCATCKRRRVKCDEARPICGNCERMGIQCVYLIPENDNNDKVMNTSDSKSISSVSSQCNSRKEDNKDHIKQEKLDQPKLVPPSTPLMSNNNLANINMPPISPISQFLQQLPQSPIATAAASQFLNNFPPEIQMKLFQQFQQLPVDKQQQLYQSLPMSVKPSSESLTMPDENLLNNLNKSPNVGTNSFADLLGDIVPNRATFMKQPLQEKIPTPQELTAQYQQRSQVSKEIPMNFENKGPSLSPDSIRSPLPPISNGQSTSIGTLSDLNMLDLRLMYHYTTKVWPTITAAGISDSKIWSDDIPMLAFKYPFLMHSVLAFSATHLSRTERGLDQCVTCHRAEALRLLREAVLEMSPENTDALVASALILIMDSLANASLPTSSSIKSLPPSAWVFHVKGAATILTAVWPLSEKSRFYKFISVDLGDLGEIGYDLISGELSNTSDSNENSRSNSIGVDKSMNKRSSKSFIKENNNAQQFINNDNDTSLRENHHRKKMRGTSTPDLSTLANMAAKTCAQSKKPRFSSIECFDNEISDMFPVSLNSPYFPTLAYMAKLHKEFNKSDFILRIFAFPALLDKRFLGLLINCDLSAMRIMRCYYKLLRNFTEEMKEKVWFLEGVSSVLPVDVEQYAGGGGMHMMLDFLGGPSTIDDDGNGENYVAKSAAQSGLLDTNNLPSASMTDSLGLDDTSGLNTNEVNE